MNCWFVERCSFLFLKACCMCRLQVWDDMVVSVTDLSKHQRKMGRLGKWFDGFDTWLVDVWGIGMWWRGCCWWWVEDDDTCMKLFRIKQQQVGHDWRLCECHLIIWILNELQISILFRNDFMSDTPLARIMNHCVSIRWTPACSQCSCLSAKIITGIDRRELS